MPRTWIKEIREHLGLTQKEFAKEICVSISAVRHWDQGLKNPSGPAAKLIIQLADKGGYYDVDEK